jgi:hypothetical protein
MLRNESVSQLDAPSDWQRIEVGIGFAIDQ